ncbi:Putative alcohol dehydrogenase, zinc-type, GroES-like superfamily, NAD(P)-binding domain superfamily [Septoria linicola]|uniref:alcohol dehydrogenase (NADP(+)) n=1 Tax=Septoria linicola TaxID=215465 RepID=A0A9Q9EJL4_9PEZI|nr:putative alcohol dehydrogenase, zinc-type, GroES-like superfamily, NAD(P)-binding domain superfamily [Septoria linicola]USW51468.1 Putative alcohol dehydrogenase, zinc-type, GroES-like superfamily, NAD(P)-binding domain superfamily [Septoria linicola]
MASETKFEGWVGLDADSVNGNMKWQTYEAKTWEESDVDIEISHCGVCGSDLHTLRSGWGETPYPAVVGHEIVGKAIRVGKSAMTASGKPIKEGDRIGVGAQCKSCLKPDCEQCAEGIENHCPNDMVGTYGAKYKNGETAQGGYAKYWRGNSHFVFHIPEKVPSEMAAPMLCGGVTTYSPLKQNGCGPGKRVGVVGIGGLGHFGLLWAKALGADKVVAISRGRSKEEDARKLGADDFIATSEEGWETKHAGSLDLIISSVSSPKMPLEGYLSLLAFQGRYIQLGIPENPLPNFSAAALVMKRATMGGSLIGAPHEIEEMLQLAADKDVKAWIQTRPMGDANQVIQDFEAGKPRYRFCLTN